MLLNIGNIKILCMTIKLKFTEPEVEVYITGTSYVGYQYLVSFVIVMRAEALACARNPSKPLRLRIRYAIDLYLSMV